MDSIKFSAKNEISLKKILLDNCISKRAYKELLENKLLEVNGSLINSNIMLNKNDEVKIIIEDEKLNYAPIEKKIKILYEDEDIIAIDKEANLTVNSKNQENLSNYIANYFMKNNIKSQIRLINRLDMNTSGIMLIAKNKYSQAYYQKEIEKDRVDKEYLALVNGKLDTDKTLNLYIEYDENEKKMKIKNKGKFAKTSFKTIKIYDNYSLIKCKIHTGKTHQIRVSLSNINHPIIGDSLYGSDVAMDRFLLHSYKMTFNRFRDGKKVTILSRPEFDKYFNLNI